ncbi:hypothetical protein B0I35DRAFT_477256 [Stachybotrys elegans]|uniref:Uncharacterized protein n=1 Tax=Stachybotrys elegans TaxID=80388 RepID=A0A8K0WRR5_9HYPO|nr:hypothetical protein B0I35DRAFT_477256 [Stachybotrys elegans]
MRLKGIAKFSKRHPMVRWVAWALFALSAAMQVLLIVYGVILIAKRDALPEPEHFDLYKNTRLEDCMTSPPSQANCSFVEEWSRPQPGPGQTFHWVARAPSGVRGWCDFASCFQGWKIIPSLPRDSAFTLTPFSIWFQLNITAINVLWNVCQSMSPIKKCKGPRAVDWGFAVFSLASVIFWAVQLSSLIRNPRVATPISLVAWITTWNLSISMGFHPWSCWSVLRDYRVKRAVSGFLGILTLLQWCGTIYGLRIHWDFYHFDARMTGRAAERYSIDKYRCSESQLASAPGRTSCSAEAICSKNGLFDSPDFVVNQASTVTIFLYTGIVFYAVVVYAAMMILSAFQETVSRWFQDTQERLAEKGWLPESGYMSHWVAAGHLGLNGGLSIVSLAYGLVMLATRNLNWNFGNLEVGGMGTITVDGNCTAMHVGMSPEWYYIDVEEYGQWRRFAQMLLNA